MTAAQIAAIKPTVSIALVDSSATDGNPNFGKYTVTGDFDALSVGDEATITFDYWSVDHSAANSATETEHKKGTITVVGQNDSLIVKSEIDPANASSTGTIKTYDQLIDGDIYKSILANDGHGANDIDVHDTLKIASTGFRDLQFYNEGGQINVDNTARILQYTPGTGGAIAKDHFSFYYQVTDGYTNPIASATAEFKMKNKDNGDIDFYQFGDNSDNTINGIKGKSNVLSGMGGDDYLAGKEKADILYGGAGDDDMHGGWGNDIYKAGKGTDGMVDTRGDDLYVFSKGDGRNTIDDTNLEIYTDAMGHETINQHYADNIDTVKFDKTVDIKKIALFQEDGQYGSMLIKYSENADDKVSVGWQQEAHYGIEEIKAWDSASNSEKTLDKTAMDNIIAYIATYDIDHDATNGLQTAQNVHDVQSDEGLMAYIAGQWA